MLMTLVQRILYKIQNHLSQYHLGVQLDLCTFGALPPIRHSSNDRCFIDHFFLTSDFRQVPRQNLFQFSQSLSTAAFAARIFMA